VHATATLNLLRRNWLTRVPALLEAAVVMLVAFLSGIRLVRVQPLASTLGAAGGILIVSLTAILLSWEFNLWFAWAIPAFTIFAAWVCSIVYTSVNLHIQKRLLEDSLAAHLSPKLVRRLIQEPALRQQGGYQQEISILFSDIANFSKVSECLSSDDLVRLMNKYFDASLNCIHQHDGTVVKLIGDAIFAIWNAPVEQPTHREHACRAALSLRDQLVKFDADRGTLPLRTRIGLHAGTASVGNIGSSTRFDYTALGENINLASRLEGLNKYLGTDVLVSREVQKGSDGAMVWRPAGHFKLKGSSRILEVYELVSSADAAERSRAWREKFAEALVDFRSRRFDLAEEKFKECSRLRLQAERVPAPTNSPVPADGPSVFYLQRIEEFRLHPPGSDWLGEVELSDK